MNEVKEFIEELRASGVYIRGEEVGIIGDIDDEKTIVPKNLVITFDGWNECAHPENCDECEFGGCCNLADYEEATISRIGGKTEISFIRWCGYQIGSVWTKWQRVG